MKYLRKHIIRTNILLIAVEVILASIIWFSGDWFFAGSEETFGTLHGYIFLWIALIIATIAALNSIFASVSAHDSFVTTTASLELTRVTTRPFLNVQLSLTKRMSLDRAIFTTEIENTGNLPADKVTVDCSWYIEESGNVKKCSLELEKPSQSTVFPADKAHCTYLVKGKENVDNLTHKGSRVKVTVNYQNKLTGQRQNTRRTFRIGFASAATSFDTAQAIVIPEEDYWD